MYVTLMMVATVNGKITLGDNPDVTNWTSPEDKALFTKVKQEHNVIVQGSASYEINKARIKLSPHTLRIVLTRDPGKYKNETVAGQLEFTSAHPKQLLDDTKARGYDKLLLLGGGEINALFLKNHCVDELHLTIEPQLFGTGKNLIAEDAISTQLQLVSVEKLNAQGTLYAIYKVRKP